MVVDHKTDDITDANIPKAIDYYRKQRMHYGHHWRESTRDNVCELGLYFTRLDSYQVCTA